VGKTWELSPKVVAWLYTSVGVVKPILSNASLVWWKRVKLKNAQKRLWEETQYAELWALRGID
jgi:hypothetical protein